ncbi:MAG: hypothetical protein V4615_13315 [Bacteroidota bacterium]
MRSILCLVSCMWCFPSCNQNQNQSKVHVVGELDSVAIAMDTTMQKGFESSYEFHKTLTVHEKLVYDVVGYGGSSSNGEYAILSRGADNKIDTVIKGIRDGIIADAYLADSNKNKREEVYVVIQNPSQSSERKILRFEP